MQFKFPMIWLFSRLPSFFTVLYLAPDRHCLIFLLRRFTWSTCILFHIILCPIRTLNPRCKIVFEKCSVINCKIVVTTVILIISITSRGEFSLGHLEQSRRRDLRRIPLFTPYEYQTKSQTVVMSPSKITRTVSLFNVYYFTFKIHRFKGTLKLENFIALVSIKRIFYN